MNTHPDFEELFRLLEKHGVDYVIVGGYAVAFHGYPRFTKDIDIFFDPSPANVARLRAALVAFGFEEQDLPEDAFSTTDSVVSFGVEPSRVNLLNEIDGVAFAEAKRNSVRGAYGSVEVSFIGRDDLIQNKRATARAQDKVEIDQLMQGA
ncbi:MAG TPA: nucleotidyltransferase [Candidatus Hydrogenedentes bacterium]|nr:nucleotidyltransferase [Candidatus Hydrogenedentota bacterium]HNT87641.1 nucleotidyltransferase [Candidatus Hydrogenedentota bacterium]